LSTLKEAFIADNIDRVDACLQRADEL